uniref:Uncharacterized protein LOC123616655 n=1 Tax=Camelus bactrianus TaxID=9837 RepID=A0A9W3G4K9_CAMBA|nr:uncharacterized protein LOC123616655 [Camelus bactrianus]
MATEREGQELDENRPAGHPLLLVPHGQWAWTGSHIELDAAQAALSTRQVWGHCVSYLCSSFMSFTLPLQAAPPWVRRGWLPWLSPGFCRPPGDGTCLLRALLGCLAGSFRGPPAAGISREELSSQINCPPPQLCPESGEQQVDGLLGPREAQLPRPPAICSKAWLSLQGRRPPRPSACPQLLAPFPSLLARVSQLPGEALPLCAELLPQPALCCTWQGSTLRTPWVPRPRHTLLASGSIPLPGSAALRPDLDLLLWCRSRPRAGLTLSVTWEIPCLFLPGETAQRAQRGREPPSSLLFGSAPLRSPPGASGFGEAPSLPPPAPGPTVCFLSQDLTPLKICH